MNYKVPQHPYMGVDDWERIANSIGGTFSALEICKEISSYANIMTNNPTNDRYGLWLVAVKSIPVYANAYSLRSELMSGFKIGSQGNLTTFFLSGLEATLIACGGSPTVISDAEYLPFKMFLEGVSSDMMEFYHKIRNSGSLRHFEDGIYINAKRDYIIGQYVLNMRKRMHLKHSIWHDVHLQYMLDTGREFVRTVARNKAIIGQCESRRQFVYELEVLGQDRVLPEGVELDLDLSTVKGVRSELQDTAIDDAKAAGLKYLKDIINENVRFPS